MKRFLTLTLVATTLTHAAVAQTGIALSGPTHSTNQKVEMTADNLTVQQASNSAVFSGNAIVAQGAVRFSADTITVQYNPNGQAISDINASGKVVFTNGVESAEANSAQYNVTSNVVVLMGNVLLLQGPTAISGDRLRLNLSTNKATVSGNVKTVFTPK